VAGEGLSLDDEVVTTVFVSLSAVGVDVVVPSPAVIAAMAVGSDR
jgi:hypothetical protein